MCFLPVGTAVWLFCGLPSCVVFVRRFSSLVVGVVALYIPGLRFVVLFLALGFFTALSST